MVAEILLSSEEQRLHQNFTIMANVTFIFDVSEFNPSSEQKEIVENCDNLTEFLYLGGKTVHFTQTKLEETLLHLDSTGVSWEWLHQGGVGPYPYS